MQQKRALGLVLALALVTGAACSTACDRATVKKDAGAQVHDGGGDGGGGADGGAGGPDAGAVDPASFEAVAARFGMLETVAGRGEQREKDVNGWLPEYEGGAATAAELSRPHNALGDDDGNLYIADKDAHAIRRVAPDGTIHTHAGMNAPGDDGDSTGLATGQHLRSPNGLWVKGDGTVFILDMGNDKVRRVAPDGTMTTLFTIGGAGAGRGLWVSDDETLAYVAAGTALKRWTRDEGVAVLASGFASLGNLAVKSDGTVIVADRDGHRVYAVSTTGDKTVLAGNGTTEGGGDGFPALESGLAEVRGVWIDEAGGLFLCTHKGGQVWYVDLAGTLHLFVNGDTDHAHSGDGESYRTPGFKISEPRAVTMDRQGNLIITENDYGYVRRIRRLP